MRIKLSRSVPTVKIDNKQNISHKLIRSIKPSNINLNVKTIHFNEKILKLQNRRFPLKNEHIHSPMAANKLQQKIQETNNWSSS